MENLRAAPTVQVMAVHPDTYDDPSIRQMADGRDLVLLSSWVEPGKVLTTAFSEVGECVAWVAAWLESIRRMKGER